MARLKTALIGHGYWGRNIARVLFQSKDFELSCVCDFKQDSLNQVKRIYPGVLTVTSINEIPKDIEAVAIITPADTHFELAKMFLEEGKHVLLTKPFVRRLAQAEELIDIAKNSGVTCFVDHTFLFHPAVRKMKEFLPRIGTPYFVFSQRLNLGLYQPDVNVIYDLMPHDFSIIAYLFDDAIKTASTSAFRTAGLPQEDLAHTNFELESGMKGLVTVSWLSPAKIRQFFVVGSKGMLVYDDTEHREKVKFFDTGISIADLQNPDSTVAYTSRISYRNGDLVSPALPNCEALSLEMEEFKRAIQDSSVRETYNRINLNVMRYMDSVINSLKT